MPAGSARLLRIGDGASQIHPIGLGRMTLGHERSCLSFIPVHSASPLFGCPLVLLRPPYTGAKYTTSFSDNFKSRISTQLFGDEAPTGAYKSYSRYR
jgi:hypothetical protein